MLEIDGSAGGGQLVRTALALSALTGTPVRMEGIRGGRPEPGLRPQHVAAVELLATISDAAVEGSALGSEALEFAPGEVQAGTYDVDIGTAGSICLLFDAVLPLGTAIDGRLAVRATGGTDVRWSPPFDYLRAVKLPRLRRDGMEVAVDLDRRGFYPAGGGEATLWLGPSRPEPLDLEAGGPVEGARVYSVASTDLAERDVAERQTRAAVEGLDDLGVETVETTVQYADAASTGSALVLRLDRGETVAGFDALGERGKPAESVADDAVSDLRAFVESSAAVDAHAADQLLVQLAVAGGRVAIPVVTEHVETSLALLDRFGYDVSIGSDGDGPVVEATGRR